jgi:DNA-binding SARP family transcriptional activator
MGEVGTLVRWQLRLVGGLAVRRADGTWEVPLGSRKSRTLLSLLAVQQSASAGRLVAALWDGAPPQQPEANVATLVSRLRAKYGPELIVGDRSAYQLGSTQVDLHDAAALIGHAQVLLRDGRPAAALLAAEHGVRLLDGGPVLSDHPFTDWADHARHLQSDLLRRGRYAAASSALHVGAPEKAQRLSAAAIAADPLDEATYRVLMRAYATTGEPARALVAYERLRTTLDVELNTAPDRATRDLHMEILRANAETA